MIFSSIRFAGNLPPVAVAIIATLAAIGVVVLYLRETKTLEMPYAYLLPALRASAVVLTIFILAQPVWHGRQIIGTLGRVVFAIDTSQSMSVTDSSDAGSSPDRLGRATSLLLGDENRDGWLKTLKDTHDVEVIAFDEDEPKLLWSSSGEDPIPSSFELTAEGLRTDLSTGLSSVFESLDPNHVDDDSALTENGKLQRGAFVMLSDGRDNFGESAVDLSKQLDSQSMVVHAIGMGSDTEPPDVGVVNIIRPESVASDGTLGGTLLLKQFGMSGKPLQVRIESQGKTIWQQTVNSTGDGLQRVPFELDVEPIVEGLLADAARGVQRRTVVMDLRAAIEPVDGDTDVANNSKSFRVAANTRDRRLLIVDGSSRWETRYLKNLFERDPAWSVNVVVYGPGTSQSKFVYGDDDGQFPGTSEAFARYDAIILGEIPNGQFGANDSFRLREFVSRGGGLIVIDGRYGKPAAVGERRIVGLGAHRICRSTSTSERFFAIANADGN